MHLMIVMVLLALNYSCCIILVIIGSFNFYRNYCTIMKGITTITIMGILVGSFGINLMGNSVDILIGIILFTNSCRIDIRTLLVWTKFIEFITSFIIALFRRFLMA